VVRFGGCGRALSCELSDFDVPNIWFGAFQRSWLYVRAHTAWMSAGAHPAGRTVIFDKVKKFMEAIHCKVQMVCRLPAETPQEVGLHVVALSNIDIASEGFPWFGAFGA